MPGRDIVRNHPDGAALTVWVVPGARRTEIVGEYGAALKVRVAAPPEKGRANKVLVVFLGEVLQAPVRLISGAGSRRKRFAVPGITVAELVDRVELLLD